MGGRTYFDFVATFKRCDDRINENFIVVVFNDDNKIIHKENVHIQWVTNPKASVWNYGITICGKRVVSNINYGKNFQYVSVIERGVMLTYRNMIKMEPLCMIGMVTLLLKNSISKKMIKNKRSFKYGVSERSVVQSFENRL